MHDDSFVVGRIYDYAIRAYQGTTYTAASVARHTMAPFGAVTGLGASATGPQEFIIGWDSKPDATVYKLYRYNTVTQEFLKVYEGSETSFVDSGLDPDRTYDYAIVATDASAVPSPVATIRVKTQPAAALLSFDSDRLFMDESGLMDELFV